MVQVLSANRKVRYYYRPYPDTSYEYESHEYDSHETSWHVGIRFGGELGMAGAATFLMAEALDRNRHVGYDTSPLR